jgi:hypothetical protein
MLRRLLPRLVIAGVVITVIGGVGYAFLDFQRSWQDPPPVVQTFPVRDGAVVVETMTDTQGMPDSSMSCRYELRSASGVVERLGSLGMDDFSCVAHRAPVYSGDVLVVRGGVGFIVKEPGRDAVTVTLTRNFFIADSDAIDSGGRYLVGLDPDLDVSDPAAWKLVVDGVVQLTSADRGAKWVPAAPHARAR